MESGRLFPIEYVQEIPLIHVSGDLDYASAPILKSTILHLLSAHSTRIILDLDKVAFIDSGGMSAIIFAIKKLSELSGHLYLVNCTPRVVQKLKIGGLTNIGHTLVVCKSPGDAIRNIQHQQSI